MASMKDVAQKAKEFAQKKAAKLSEYMAPNGKYYEQNDIDYLMNNGYSLQDALDTLAQSEKYAKKAASGHKPSGHGK